MKSKNKVFISTFPFGRHDSACLELLETNNIEVVLNKTARKLKPHETANYAKHCDAIVAGTEDLLPLVEQTEQLKIISRVGIGLDSVPLELCHKKKIAVAYTPDAVTPAVGDLTIALMLDMCRYVSFSDRELRQGGWSRPVGLRLGEAVIGLIGFGRVGSLVAKLLSGFRPKAILVNDVLNKSDVIDELIKKYELSIKQVSMETILQESDIISLHTPQTKDTIGMVNQEFLSRLKPSAILINTSRGPIVDEETLYSFLQDKKIQGAALDVFCEEPYTGKLRELENVLLTQHMGSCSFDARRAMEYGAAEAVVDFFAGRSLKNPVL